jgi:hypothetical protein
MLTTSSAGGILSSMIPELQLYRVRLQIALFFQIWWFVFPYVMIEQRHGDHERKMALTILLYDCK